MKKTDPVQGMLQRAIESVRSFYPTIPSIKDTMKVQPMNSQVADLSKDQVKVGWNALSDEQGIARVKELCPNITNDAIAKAIFCEICTQDMVLSGNVTPLLDFESTLTSLDVSQCSPIVSIQIPPLENEPEA